MAWPRRKGKRGTAAFCCDRFRYEKNPRALISTFAVIAVFLACGPAGQTRETVTKATVDAWMTDLSNWGRWGDEDQLGAVNLITPEKRKQAAALVQDGVSVSLAHNVEKEEAADNPRPFVHRMLNTGDKLSGGQFVSDEYTVGYHGFAHTHMDSSPTCLTRANPTTASRLPR